ncbi:MAG: hypothetical protein H7X93_10195, partial [Sphingomonadaceae bacterium]|nr:hypothetical protein [Sphingomonadaceae bacterium]
MPTLAAVPESYRHYAKQAVPRAPLEVAGAAFKFYHLEKPGEPVPAAL